MTDETGTTDWASDVQKAIDEDLEQSSRWFHIWWAFYIILATFMAFSALTAEVTFHGTTGTLLKHVSFINFILGLLGIVGLMLHATTGTLRPPSFKPAAMNIFETTLTRHGSEARGASAPRDEAEQGKAAEALVERAGIEIAARSLVIKPLAPPVATIFARLSAPVIVTALSLILLLVYHTTLFAIVTFVVGLTITQIQHYTMPSAAMKYVERTLPDLFDVLTGKVQPPAVENE
jgi:hypothetical protein